MEPTERLVEQLLVLRYQAGDDSALVRLVEQYHAPLHYFIRRLLGQTEGVDDMLQDVWLSVIRKLRALHTPSSFSVWLYRVARNRVYQELRKKTSFAELGEDIPMVDAPDNEPGFSPQDAARIHTGLECLRPEHREVLVLRYVEEMPYEEIAQVVGCSLGTIKSRIYYAKRALLKEMEATSNDT